MKLSSQLSLHNTAIVLFCFLSVKLSSKLSRHNTAMVFLSVKLPSQLSLHNIAMAFFLPLKLPSQPDVYDRLLLLHNYENSIYFLYEQLNCWKWQAPDRNILDLCCPHQIWDQQKKMSTSSTYMHYRTVYSEYIWWNMKEHKASEC